MIIYRQSLPNSSGRGRIGMDAYQDIISRETVSVARQDLRKMLRLVRLIDRLGRDAAYRDLVYPMLPASARFDPGHEAVMMCYDFHLTPDGPRLIEVNTNAGGGLFAAMAHNPDAPASPDVLRPALRVRLLDTFAREMQLYSRGTKQRPARLVIVDDAPKEQFLYPEMQAFVALFNTWGVPSAIVTPEQLMASAAGVRYDGSPVDMIYNRHCDFYLESEAMAGVREAYLSGSVCLSPNPHAYGLLADKRRMVLWSDPDLLQALGLPPADCDLLTAVVPKSFLLENGDLDRIWQERKTWVFKPVDSFGSRGVLLGTKISRTRFDQLPPSTTLVQQLAPPSQVDVADFGPMKVDLRLYAYCSEVLGVTARLYRGQVTNMRTPGGGFAPVRLI